jgi:hypothetical protein
LPSFLHSEKDAIIVLAGLICDHRNDRWTEVDCLEQSARLKPSRKLLHERIARLTQQRQRTENHRVIEIGQHSKILRLSEKFG